MIRKPMVRERTLQGYLEQSKELEKEIMENLSKLRLVQK